MWRTIIKNDCVYLIKLIISPRCGLFLSDLKELWMEQLPSDENVKRFKELNPLCQTTDVIKELTDLFSNITSDQVTLKFQDGMGFLTMKNIVDDFEIKFNWELSKQSDDMFFKEITLNLVNTITTLENRKERLYYLLERKDKEKEEYIREYGEISRDLLKTNKFYKEKFIEESSNTMLNILSNEEVVNSLNEKYQAKIIKRKCNDLDDKANTKKLRKYNPKFLKK